MNSAKKCVTVARICHRQFSQANEVVAPRFSKLKTIQKKFQIDDGTPVYLKTGMVDKVLYNTTALLSVIGVGLSLHTFVNLVLK